MKTIKKDELLTKAFETRAEMGAAAAADIEACIVGLLAEKDEINMIFAAAPSQNDVLAALVASKKIEWNRINAFHMDEYVGLAPDAPQRFAAFLSEHIFSLVPFKSVHYINGGADTEAECRRYTELLQKYPTDIVVMGIGENGHIAFNDPPVADFKDKKTIKVVALDDTCRMQQVHDGCFPTFDDVPKNALSLTVPALVKADRLFCIVPAATKAEAVRHTLSDEISEKCPATILRTKKDAILYLDKASSALLDL